MSRAPEKNVWFVQPLPPSSIGGIETTTRAWIQAFHRSGYNPHWMSLLTRQDSNRLGITKQDDVIETHNTPLLGLTLSYLGIEKFMKRINSDKPEHVIFNGFRHTFSWIMALVLAQQASDVSVVFHADVNDPPPVKPGYSLPTQIRYESMRRIRRSLVDLLVGDHSTRKIAVSSEIADQVKDKYPSAKVIVCNPSSPACVCGGSSQTTIDTSLRALTVSRVSPNKGIEDLVELAKQSNQMGLPVIYRLVGPVQSLDYERHINSIRPPNLELIGPKTGESLCEELNSATLLVSPSPSESFGLSINEALRHRLPVMACDSPPVREQLNRFNRIPGMLVDSGDFAAQVAFLSGVAEFPQMLTGFRDTLNEEAINIPHPNTLSDQFVHLIAGN